MSVGRRAIVAVSVTIVAAVAFSAWLGPEWCPPSSALLGAGLGLVFGIVPTLWALAPRLCGLSLELRSGRLVAKFGGAEIAVDLEEIEEARLVESFERLVRIGGAALPGCYAGRFAARGVGSFRLYGERPSPALLVKLREGRALAFATRDRALLESLSRQLSEARAGGGPARRPAQISSGPSGMLLALTLLVLAAASVLAVAIYAELPSEVPTDYGPRGEPESYGPKEKILTAVLALMIAEAAASAIAYRFFRDVPLIGAAMLLLACSTSLIALSLMVAARCAPT